MNYVDLILLKKLGRDSLLVNLNGDCPGAVCFKDFCDFVIAGIFYGNFFSAAKKLNQHGIKGFGSRTDDNLLRGNAHIAEGCQIAGNCQAQLVNAADCLTLKQLLVAGGKDGAHFVGPLGKGEALGGGGVVTEIEKEGGGGGRGTGGGIGLLGGGRGRWRGGRGTCRCDISYKKAFLLNRINIAFANQLLVGILNGDDADTQMGGQRPLGRKLFVSSQLPAPDLSANRITKKIAEPRPAPLRKINRNHNLILTKIKFIGYINNTRFYLDYVKN